ncbi:hypothetical protein TWF694_004933 [Orbilia ellipsospora]|uniref:Pentatricopeptide repeat protein n=1 Tax=Orbilia ellipsospora TaxID=2528407 RepID=A0AAV9WVG0_9PEZI
MLQKVTVRARRSYNWICSDCRQRLGYPGAQVQTVRPFNCSSSLSYRKPATTRSCSSATFSYWRRPVISTVASRISIYGPRFYTDGPPRDEESLYEADQDEDLQSGRGPRYDVEDEEFEEIQSGFLEESGEEPFDGEGKELKDYEPTVGDMEELLDTLDKPEKWKDVELEDPELLNEDAYFQEILPEHDVVQSDDAPSNDKLISIPTESIPEGILEEPRDLAEGPPKARAVGSIGTATFWRPKIIQWLHQKPSKRKKYIASLERMNAALSEGGYQLIPPNEKWHHKRVVTRSMTITPGYKVSIWQMFKANYIRRYREGDQSILMGRPAGWKPTQAELHKEYQNYYWEHKQNITRLYSLHRNWHNAPDVRKSFTNVMYMLTRFTRSDTLVKYRFRKEHEKRENLLIENVEGEVLEQIVADWQQPLEEFDPTTYKPLTVTVNERARAMSALKYWKPPRSYQDIEEFKLQYMKDIDIENLARVFGVKINTVPLSADELLALIQSISMQKISKQDLRYLLPPEYENSIAFFSHTIICILVSHESYGVLNTSIMNTAINYMMKFDEIKKGRHLIEYMSYLRIPMNIGTFREALKASAKAKDIFVFERLVRRLMLKGSMFDHEVWQAFLACAHSAGQKLQIFQEMVNLGMDPKKLAPTALLKLAFGMYKDQLRMGNKNAVLPWKHLRGIQLDASTVNPILQFLYDHNAYDEARTFLWRVTKTHKMMPNMGTLRIIVRENCRRMTLWGAVKAVFIFEKHYGIKANSLIFEQIFQLAHRSRHYNVVRTVWAHACLTNQVTKRMIDRMRHDIYETGRNAGKPGKLALGVCSENSEEVVNSPVWAMRLVSKARDPLGFLMSDGEGYHNPEIMKDLEDVKARMERIYEFRNQTIQMRKELLRLDLFAHNNWQPRRKFSIDLVAAMRRDRWLRTDHPQCHKWSPLRWAWSMFQVRRGTKRGGELGAPLNFDTFERRKPKKEDVFSDARAHARAYSILEQLPTRLTRRSPLLANPDWKPPDDTADGEKLSLAEADPLDEMGEEEELTGKDLYAFYEDILNDDLGSPESAGYDFDFDGDDEAHSLDDEFLEREASLALDEVISSWDHEPGMSPDATYKHNEVDGWRSNDLVERRLADDGDESYTERMARRAAAARADEEAKYAPPPPHLEGPKEIDTDKVYDYLYGDDDEAEKP